MSAIHPKPSFVTAEKILSQATEETGSGQVDKAIQAIFKQIGRFDSKGKEEAFEAIKAGLNHTKLNYSQKAELTLYAEANIQGISPRTVVLKDGSIELSPSQLHYLIKNSPSFKDVPLQGDKKIVSPISLKDLTWMVGDITDRDRAIHPIDIAKEIFSLGSDPIIYLDDLLENLKKHELIKRPPEGGEQVYDAVKESLKRTGFTLTGREDIALSAQARFLNISPREVLLAGNTGKKVTVTVSPQEQLFLIKSSTYFENLWGSTSEKPGKTALPMTRSAFSDMTRDLLDPRDVSRYLKEGPTLENLATEVLAKRLADKSVPDSTKMEILQVAFRHTTKNARVMANNHLQSLARACKSSEEFRVFVEKHAPFITKLELNENADNSWLPYLENLPNLVSLNFSRSKINNLTLLSKLTQLHELEFMGTTAISDFTPLSVLPNLSKLKVAYAGKQADFSWISNFRNLEHLVFEGCRIDDATLPKLIENISKLEKLKRFSLKQNRIGDAGVTLVVSSPALQQLSYLSLEGNPIGDLAAIALAESYLAQLTTLSLRGCNNIHFEGVRDLIESPHLTQLSYLYLPKQQDTRETILELAELRGIEVDFSS